MSDRHMLYLLLHINMAFVGLFLILVVPFLVYAEETATLSINEQLDFSEIKIEHLHKKECERKTKKHDVIYVHYKGFLEDGTEFDSSYTSGKPHLTQLGTGLMIKGLQTALMGMCAGEKRKVTIPPHLAFGDKGNGKAVGPGETLTYELEIVEITDGKSPAEMFETLDLDGNEELSLEEVSEYMKSQIQSQGAYRSIGNNVDTILDATFKIADKNKDGVLDKEELEIGKHDEL